MMFQQEGTMKKMFCFAVSFAVCFLFAGPLLYAQKEDSDIKCDAQESCLAIGVKLSESNRMSEALFFIKRAQEYEGGGLTKLLPVVLALAYYARGYDYLLGSSLERALIDFDSAINILPNEPKINEAYFYRGVTHLLKHECENGVDDLEKAEKLGYKENNLLSNLGAGYYCLRDFEKAAEVLEESLQKDPEDKSTMINLAETYIGMNEIDKAMEISENLIKTTEEYDSETEALKIFFKEWKLTGKPPDTDSFEKSAADYFDAKKFEEAANFYSAILLAQPDDSVTAYNVAECFKNMNEGMESLQYFYRYLYFDHEAKDKSDIRKTIYSFSKGLKSNGTVKKSNIVLKVKKKTCNDKFNEATMSAENGDREGALNALSDARDCFLIESGGKENDESILTLLSTGNNFLGLGKFSNAEKYMWAVLESSYETYTEQNPFAAGAYTSLGLIEKLQNNHAAALDYYLTGLQMTKELQGDDSLEIAIIYDNIGNLYNSMNEKGHSLDYHLKALKIFEERSDVDTKDLMTIYNNISNDYFFNGDEEKGLSYMDKALNLAIDKYGENNSTTAIAYDNYGTFMRKTNAPEKALEYHLKALKTFQSTLGDINYNTYVVFRNLIETYLMLDRMDDAIESGEKALSIAQNIFKKNNPDILSLYLELSEYYEGKGEVEKAEEYYDKSKGE
jgi:tetratricopeptide (TPR) repeat protein